VPKRAPGGVDVARLPVSKWLFFSVLAGDMGKIVKIVFLLVCGLGCSYANAGSFQLGVEAGSASPYDNDYKRTDVIHLMAGYEFIDDVLLAEIGVFEFDDDFGLKDRPASIGLEGTDLQSCYVRFPFFLLD
jgi:hypothetical protein